LLQARVELDFAVEHFRHDLKKIFSFPWFSEACDKVGLEIPTCVSVIKTRNIR